ncbi:hypothetical protein ABBQ38_001787 [Trebouxia sp. C0009 RCD-2024]
MGSPVGPQETGHADTVHDVQLDYYGRKLATASSDRTIKVFDVTGDQLTPLTTLHGHDGPVWQVSWSHPKFGNLLASCSFDNSIMIWKEQQDGSWMPVYTTDSSLHSASVNSVAFAPHELGLKVAAASSDGSASVLTYNTTEGKWDQQKVDAHSVGCTAVSWSPAAPPGSLVSGKPPAHAIARFATAGCDRTVRIWHYDESKRQWAQQGQPLKGHTDWVRDVAWAPNLGMPMNTIASAGQDGKVLIWTEQNNQWSQLVLCDLQQPVWKLSWSVTGGILAVSDSKGNVTLWKEAIDGQWQQISQNAAAA